MADDVTYQSATPATPPSGTVIATDEAGSPARQYQLVKLVDGTANSETPIVGMAAQPAGTEGGLVTRPASAIPDVTASGTIDALNEDVSIAISGRLAVSAVITGTFTATLYPEVSYDDGATWVSAQIWRSTSGTTVDTISTEGSYLITPVMGATHARLVAYEFTSGSITVALRATMTAQPILHAETLGGVLPAGTLIVGGAKQDGTANALRLTGAEPLAGTQGLVTREAARGQGTMAASIPTVIASDQSAVPVSGPLTDTQLRATPVPVSGTVTASGPLTDTQLRASAVPVSDGAGTLTVDAPVGTPVNVQIGNATLSAGVVDETGSSAVDALAVGGGTPHDSVDSGDPIKIGVKAASAFPTAVAANDRANVIGDLWGRPMVTHIDPAQQVWKSFNATSTQTGVTIWDPTSGKKIAITSIVIGTYGTTAGRAILWFGANGDTTYSAGTDQLVLAFSSAPSASSKPGLVFTPAVPIFNATADVELHITTDANLSIDVAVYGYEW